MSTVKINGKEYEFKIRFSQLMKIYEKTGTDLQGLEDFVKDQTNLPMIVSLGLNKSIEEATELLDSVDSYLETIDFIKVFNDEVVRYISPNSQSQAI